ncbi:MAG: hypothetical protein K2I99_03695 [Bacteroidaceae bacterium]|nr:hypothetical protein [Bacteroidaceae bacterium]
MEIVKKETMKKVYEYDSGDSQDCVKLSEPAVAYADTYMPCIFTADELEEEVLRSEASGSASEQEVQSFFTKWGC